MRNKGWNYRWNVTLLLAVLITVPMLQAQTVSDTDLLQTVQAQISSEKYGKDIQVGVDAGVVTLNGTVATLEQKERIWKTVTKIAGVTGAKNNLQIAAAAGDQQLAEAAAHAVRMYSYYSIFDNVEILADNGVLTLKGQVITPWRKADLGARMKSVAGVREIQNALEVLPVSPYDDQIRLRVARAIFGDPGLIRYGLGANPSIHIIVQNGNVRLTGVVMNAMDKALAERAARFAAIYFGFTNDLRIA
jgi:hyperosmotically inducible periplasmic protein